MPTRDKIALNDIVVYRIVVIMLSVLNSSMGEYWSDKSLPQNTINYSNRQDEKNCA